MFSIKKKGVETANSPATHKLISICSFRQNETDLLPGDLVPRISEASEKYMKSPAFDVPSQVWVKPS